MSPNRQARPMETGKKRCAMAAMDEHGFEERKKETKKRRKEERRTHLDNSMLEVPHVTCLSKKRDSTQGDFQQIPTTSPSDIHIQRPSAGATDDLVRSKIRRPRWSENDEVP